MSFFEHIQIVDELVLLTIEEHLHGTVLDSIVYFFSSLGDAGIIWIVLGILMLIFKPSRRNGFLLLLSLLFTHLTNDYIVKALVDRPRPFETLPELDYIGDIPGGSSFPSGHTATAFGSAFMLKHCKSRLGNPALIFAILMGLSRVFLTVHYPTDVIGGMLWGLIISTIVWNVCKRLFGRRY